MLLFLRWERSADLEKRTEQTGDILDSLREQRTLTPLLRCQALASRDIERLFRLKARSRGPIVDDQAGFTVQQEGTYIDIAGTDNGDFVVDREVLGMEKAIIE